MSDSPRAQTNELYSPIDDDPIVLDPDDSARVDLPEPEGESTIDPEMRRRLDEAVAAARRRRELAEVGLSEESGEGA